MNGSEAECGQLVHHIRGAHPETEVRVVPIYYSEPLENPPDEWTLLATVTLEFGVRCLDWATRKGCVCQLRNWPIDDIESQAN